MRGQERSQLEEGRAITFVVASHRPEVLHANLAQSSAWTTHDFIVVEGQTSVARAYNSARVDGELVVYVHHDVFLPEDFIANLTASVAKVEGSDPNWGVLGVAGVVTDSREKRLFGHCRDRGNDWTYGGELPHEVDTLDELLLVTHGDLEFDELIPGNHFYGADICMQARLAGRKCYAIDAYCHHNSGLGQGELPDDFSGCQDYFAKKYRAYLPISTTCATVTDGAEPGLALKPSMRSTLRSRLARLCCAAWESKKRGGDGL